MAAVTKPLLDVLDDRPRDAFTPLQLARLVDCSYDVMRTTLCRLAKPGRGGQPPRVARVARGLYQNPAGLIYPGGVDPRLRIHALKIEARVHKEMGWPFRRTLSKVTSRFGPRHGVHPRNNSVSFRSEWNARHLTITVHPDETGLVEVFLEASVLPLHLLEVFAYLDGFIPGAFGIPKELWAVRQADWNVDVPGSLAVDLGVNSLSVSAFSKFILKVYQKAEETVRAEVRSFQALDAKALSRYLEGILLTVREARRWASG